MRVLDLFSGTGGWSEAFLRRGHDVYRIDNDEQFRDVDNTVICDILEIQQSDIDDYLQGTDIVLASPPCQAFSLAATGTHMFAKTFCRKCGEVLTKQNEKWTSDRCPSPDPLKNIWLEPRTEFGKLSVALVERTLQLVEELRPRFWWMENPNGGMIHFVPTYVPRVQVTYCQYGEDRQKLTNLWGKWPATWVPRPRCKNGAPCHESAPRGAKTGTQGIKGARDRAVVPYELSLEVCLAVESATR